MPQQTAFRLPQLTPRQLIALTPKQVKDRAARCRVVGRQYSIGSRIGFVRSRPKYPVWYNEQRNNSVCTESRRYSYVRFYGAPGTNTPVWIWCSCEHFAYTYEWVLAQYGSSSVSVGHEERGVDIIDKPPTIRNPNQRPGMCKHLVLTLRDGLQQTRDLAGEKGAEAQERGAATVEMIGQQPRLIVPEVSFLERGGLAGPEPGRPETDVPGPEAQGSR